MALVFKRRLGFGRGLEGRASPPEPVPVFTSAPTVELGPGPASGLPLTQSVRHNFRRPSPPSCFNLRRARRAVRFQPPHYESPPFPGARRIMVDSLTYQERSDDMPIIGRPYNMKQPCPPRSMWNRISMKRIPSSNLPLDGSQRPEIDFPSLLIGIITG